jgi:hypothetical protein
MKELDEEVKKIIKEISLPEPQVLWTSDGENFYGYKSEKFFDAEKHLCYGNHISPDCTPEEFNEKIERIKIDVVKTIVIGGQKILYPKVEISDKDIENFRKRCEKYTHKTGII